MDWPVFHGINNFSEHTEWLHAPMRSYAKYGVVVFAILLVIGTFLSLRGRRPRDLARTFWAAIAPLVALALNQPIANAVDRARPYAAHPNVLVLVSRSADPSFMSDHSVVAGAVAAGLCFVRWRLGVVAIAFAALLAFARVYVGAHYPGDVLAGLVFGAGIAAAGIPLVDRFATPAIALALATAFGRRVLRAIPGAHTSPTGA